MIVGTLDGRVEGSVDDDIVGPVPTVGASLGFKIETATKGLLDGSQEGSILEPSVSHIHDAMIPKRHRLLTYS
jgi:hypothetical protein